MECLFSFSHLHVKGMRFLLVLWHIQNWRFPIWWWKLLIKERPKSCFYVRIRQRKAILLQGFSFHHDNAR